MLSDPLFYAVAIPAVLLRGVSKAGFGSGLGSFSLPLLLLVLSPTQALALLLPLLILTDLMGLKLYLPHVSWATLRRCLPGMLLGVGAGTLALDVVPAPWVLVLIGLISIVFVLYGWLANKAAAAPRDSALRADFWSALSGFTSFVSHSGGPPLQIYLLGLQLDKLRFIATINVFFCVTNLAKGLPYLWLGQFDTQILLAALVLTPFVPLGVYLGYWLQQRIDQRRFNLLTRVFLLLTGCYLLVSGLFQILN